MKLTSENVEMVFMACLFKNGEPTENHIAASGVMIKIGFSPERIEENKETISQMLDELPDSFKKSGGGGMSFLDMCEDKSGEQWTGLHTTVDMLVCLGLAANKISYTLPREFWEALPGGMPYITVN